MFTNLFSRFSPLNWIRQLIRNPRTRVITIAAIVLYLISPLDFMPDFIPVVGWIDDAVLASILFAELANIIKARKLR